MKVRTGVQLNEDTLLIGFSRRAVPYKRSDFIFSDRKKVDSLFKSGRLQIIFSGKAHPLDDRGKEIVDLRCVDRHNLGAASRLEARFMRR